MAGLAIDPNLGSRARNPSLLPVLPFAHSDLVKAGVAPDPDHGLVASLPPSVVAGLQHGAHLITVRANVSGCGAYAWTLPPNGPALPCVCDGAPCRCPSDMGNILPLRVIGTETNDTAVGKRATIRLGGSGVAVTVRGYEHVEVAGIEVLHADHGVLASGQHGIGPLVVRDMVFRGVWNRSSIGQSRQHNGRDCANVNPLIQRVLGSLQCRGPTISRDHSVCPAACPTVCPTVYRPTCSLVHVHSCEPLHPVVPVSRCPGVPVSRCLVVTLSRCRVGPRLSMPAALAAPPSTARSSTTSTSRSSRSVPLRLRGSPGTR